ncbi:MAG TPA: protein kinase, partial [Bryobacteraceae bacterium]|nr:protein kinase [Bryobacteraceae bacterium]
GLLGAGGMGEVYRARDTRLKREVALKMLPEAFANDLARMARFQREAEVLASINHPNIAHLYGFEERALVMELVEGETLTAPLPLDTALNYARQIAEALEYAHEKGVIHRDLKPANIKVTQEGVVKLLDFGLAKAIEGQAVAVGDPAISPTLTVGATQAGTILGTAAYMSPEQAAGKPADRRADIWSFGAVLYEMLAGKRAFAGESISETLASVLKAEPDWGALPAATPAPIVKLLRRCLTKDRKHRLQAVGDARIELESPIAEETARTTAPSQSRLGVVATGAAGLFFAIAAALAFIHFREKQPEAEVMRFQISAPGSSDALTYPIVSPNGRMIAFMPSDQSVVRSILWVRPVDSVDARPLPGTESVGAPFWSPDSRFLAFYQNGKLKKVDVSGGTPQTLCDVTGNWRSGDWSRDGVILFGSVGHGLMRVSDSGGPTSPVTSLDPSWHEDFHASPSFLADGRHFVYYRDAIGADNRGVYVGSLDAKPEQQKPTRVASTRPAVYVPSTDPDTGYLLFQQEDALMAQRFDNRRLSVSGHAVLLAAGLPHPIGHPRFSASETGVLAYFTGSMSPLTQLTWFDRGGRNLENVGEPGPQNSVVLSPDGSRAAVSEAAAPWVSLWDRFGQGYLPTSPDFDIWVRDFAHRTRERITTDPSAHWMAVWSPDGARLAFAIRTTGSIGIYQKTSNGVGNEEVLLKSDALLYPYDWSPDGRFLVYGIPSGSHYDLWYLPVTGDDRQPKAYLQSQFSQTQAQFSPDGRFVAYTSDENGRSEIYVRPFPNASGGRWLVSTNGGTQPRWRRDGKELFYISADSKMMAAGVTTTPEFKKLDDPKALFTVPVLGGGSATNVFRYDVSRDGQRFLIDASATETAATRPPVTIVLNWQALLKR